MATKENLDRTILISHLHDQFWSNEYYLAATRVRNWKATKGSDWAKDLFDKIEKVDSVPDEEAREALKTNAARRLIKSYFRKTQQLCSRGFLELEDLSQHLAMPQRLSMLFEIIEPFEEARKNDYSREMFDFYDDLHKSQLVRPSR
ncbi:uncharacterized protein METZ01_LOCUS473349 [marine metagenome]|uniref:Uncharacterized protein n=1 Tax=marine metagenome TaxID=408172 RepID=A0A383BMB8_9ZZZZ